MKKKTQIIIHKYVYNAEFLMATAMAFQEIVK